MPLDPERRRLQEHAAGTADWKRWGPYLSERAWGTVREDYSADGDAWAYFPFEHARARVYRWNEDGLLGLSDDHQRICLAPALWNGRDPFLKERLFGLDNRQGNHGEDVKECFFFLDNTPTHAYMRALYKYPQAAFPYGVLVAENARRDRRQPEYELLDTGIFDDDRYFDVTVEYAKAAPDDILMRVTADNRGPEPALLHVLPTIWFRNKWAWKPGAAKPSLWRAAAGIGHARVALREARHGNLVLHADGAPDLLFTENETNAARLFGAANSAPFVKDGINDAVVGGAAAAVNPAGTGTKCAAHYMATIPAGGRAVFRLRLAPAALEAPFGDAFDATIEARRAEADAFYAGVIPADLSPDAADVMRQAFAGLLWSKQYYQYVVRDWLAGDPLQPPPPPERLTGRNHEWTELYNADVLSMPDTWEYPWYASWDLAFHCIPLALVDPAFAKAQLLLLLREWYMRPNGQLPAYEWNFSDVNPPVHAWAALRVFRIERKRTGEPDWRFLERVFHKLLLNFTWWVNRKDAQGNNLFEGGFLGLDNIGVFDRSAALAGGAYVEQSDGTAWMAMFTLNMLAIAMELAPHDAAYEDIASKFFEHFLYIAHALSGRGADSPSLWDEADGFYYDVLHTDGARIPLKVRSMVGLIPLLAVETIETSAIACLPGFQERMAWFLEHRPDLMGHVASVQAHGVAERHLMSVTDRDQLRRILRVMLDEREFLSPHGLRALSRVHKDAPYVFRYDGDVHLVDYEPAESTTALFGGNSNWRGPVWFPLNYLIIEALQKFDYYFGDDLRVECPTGSGQLRSLWEVSVVLSQRLSSLFLRDAGGRRPAHGERARFADDPYWKDLVLFYEYFNGDTGAGLGASHQTGWTALVAKLLQQSGDSRIPPR